MQLLRKIFFYIFLSIYIIGCPVLIMYALGFIYEPESEKVFIETGLIYLSTVPTGAEVYLSGEGYKGTTPLDIRDLLPGDYPVKIKLKDYKTWDRTLPVEKEKATAMNKILLLPEKWKKESLSEETFDNITPLNYGSEYLLISAGEKLSDFYFYSQSKNEVFSFLEKDSPLKDFNVLKYFSLEEGDAAVLYGELDKKKKYLWVYIKNNEVTLKDISNLIPDKARHVKWSPEESDNIFVFAEDSVSRIEIKEGAVFPDYIKDVKGFGVSGSQIYVLTGDNVLKKMSYDKSSEQILLDDRDLAASIFGGKEAFEIYPLPDELILFVGENGKLLANHLPFKFIDSGTRGLQPLPNNKKVLVWKKDRIGILDFSTEETGNVAFEKGVSLSWVYSKGKDIQQAFWVYDGSHILFLDQGKLLLVELNMYGDPQFFEIFNIKNGTLFFYSDSSGEAYYLDNEGNFNSTNIMPVQETIPSPFLDKAVPEDEKQTYGKGK